MPSGAPAGVRPGLTAISPEPSEATPLIVIPAPWSAGIFSRVHAVPPLVLSHAALYAPVRVATAPEITVALPREVTYEMLGTVSPGPARPSCAAVDRCQVRPSRDVQITPVCCPFSGPLPVPAAR